MNRKPIIDKKKASFGQMGGPYPWLQDPNTVRIRDSRIRYTGLHDTYRDFSLIRLTSQLQAYT